MESLFVPYEIALALKELGFGEPCLGYFTKNSLELREPYPLCGKTHSAILYQQAFRWFREKYELSCSIELTDNSRHYYYDFTIFDSKNRDYNDLDCFDSCKRIYDDGKFGKYEEAELECLKKLISIVKEK